MDEVQLHSQQAQEKENKCHLCGKVYPYPQYLSLHLKGCLKDNQTAATSTSGSEEGDTDSDGYDIEDGTEIKRENDQVSSPINTPTLLNQVFQPEIIDLCSDDGNESAECNDVNIDTRQIGMDKELFGCTTCSKTYTTQWRLNNHMARHTGNKDHRCTICPKTFFTSSDRYEHVVRVHNDFPCQCESCLTGFSKQCKLKNRSFQLSVNLQVQLIPVLSSLTESDLVNVKLPWEVQSELMEPMEEEEEIFDYQSEEVMSESPATIDSPEPISKTAETYKCDRCDKQFTNKWSLKRHLLVHSDNKPHKCWICGKAYKRKDELQKHSRKKHNFDVTKDSMSQKISNQWQEQETNQDYEEQELHAIMGSYNRNARHADLMGGVNHAEEEVEIEIEEDLDNGAEHAVENEEQRNSAKMALDQMENIDVKLEYEVERQQKNEEKSEKDEIVEKSSACWEKERNQGVTGVQEERVDENEIREHMFGEEKGEKEGEEKQWEDQRREIKEEPIEENDQENFNGFEQRLNDFNLEDGAPLHEETRKKYEISNVVPENCNKCEVCNKSFASKQNMIRHRKNKVCAANIHMKDKTCTAHYTHKKVKGKKNKTCTAHYTHKKVKGKKSFKCKQCSKKFNCRLSLDRHVILHTGDAPYVCFTCGKGFLYQSDWKRHSVQQQCNFRADVPVLREEQPTSEHGSTNKDNIVINHATCKMKCPQEIELENVSHFSPHTCSSEDIDKGNGTEKQQFADNAFASSSRNLRKHAPCDTKLKTLKCHSCSKMFFTNGCRVIHMRNVHGALPYRCLSCQVQFAWNYELKNHICSLNEKRQAENVDQGSNTIRSSYQEEFDNQPNVGDDDRGKNLSNSQAMSKSTSSSLSTREEGNPVKKTLERDTVKSKRVNATKKKRQQGHHLCPICYKGLSTRNRLIVHMRIHYGAQQYQCNNCTKRFIYKTSLKRHVRLNSCGPPRSDKDTKAYKLTKKAATLTSSTETKRKTSINNANAIESDNTSSQLPLKKKFKEMKKRVDWTGERDVQNSQVFNCDICDRRYSHKKSLMQHLLLHKTEKGLRLPIENKTYALDKVDESRAKKNTKKKCRMSEQTFKRNHDLERHLRTKHPSNDEFTERKERVQVPGNAFNSRNSVSQNHPKSRALEQEHHRVDEPLICSICDRSFSGQGKKHRLRRHMLIHTGEGSVDCAICGRKFGCSEYMKRHLKNMHKNILSQ